MGGAAIGGAPLAVAGMPPLAKAPARSRLALAPSATPQRAHLDAPGAEPVAAVGSDAAPVVFTSAPHTAQRIALYATWQVARSGHRHVSITKHPGSGGTGFACTNSRY